MKQINKYICDHFENDKFSILEHVQNSNFSIVERLHINKDIDHHNYHPKKYDELKELINELIEERGDDANLNDIDTSQITDMTELFSNSKFNGDISDWDVSNVKNMNGMFAYSKFTSENGDISNWDVSNVKTMTAMFYKSPLEKNPPKWYKE